MDGDYVPLGEAQRRLGVSLPLLRRRVLAGELPVFVDGRDRRLRLVRVEDLERLRQQRPIALGPGGTPPATA